jgi:signal transduction histidine kinase
MSPRVAHEIKNPLTPLMLAARQARMFAAQGRTEALEEPLQVIADEAARLDELARTFSQMGRLPEGPPSKIDLVELLRGLLARDLPQTIRGTLDAQEGVPQIEGHLEALTRAFRNLLGNAVEALTDRSDGRIEVTVALRSDTVVVSIADNGAGIRAEDRDRVWDPDFTTKRRGTGLGLALVRQTVRAHGGDVTMGDSQEGACFVLHLPTKKTPGSG